MYAIAAFSRLRQEDYCVSEVNKVYILSFLSA